VKLQVVAIDGVATGVGELLEELRRKHQLDVAGTPARGADEVVMAAHIAVIACGRTIAERKLEREAVRGEQRQAAVHRRGADAGRRYLDPLEDLRCGRMVGGRLKNIEYGAPLRCEPPFAVEHGRITSIALRTSS
jgi:hypothetical protein